MVKQKMPACNNQLPIPPFPHKFYKVRNMKFLTTFAFANARKPHAAVRDTFRRVGNLVVAVRDTFRKVGNPAAAVQDTFRKVGNLVAAVQDTFRKSGNLAVEFLIII